jgi:hypothetical protein
MQLSLNEYGINFFNSVARKIRYAEGLPVTGKYPKEKKYYGCRQYGNPYSNAQVLKKYPAEYKT